MMITVRNILKEKGSAVWSIAPEGSVYQALKTMADKNVGALLVLENGKLVGIFSERDYARKALELDRSPRDLRVHELMTEKVHIVRPGQSLGACMALMTEKRVRHLPVVEGEKVVGVISIGDVVKAIIAEQQEVINELGSYLSGER
jgi:CBS domain-containing protein